MKQHDVVGYAPGVLVTADGERLTFEARHLRLRAHISDRRTRTCLLDMAERPVPRDDVAVTTLAFLLRHGLVTTAAHPPHLQGLRAHAEASMPLNQGLAYTPQDLAEYVRRARLARFLPGTASGTSDLPLALRRRPSFAPFDGPRAAPVDEAAVLAVMRTLHDPETRLYPSAGALYPVRLIAEQAEPDRSSFTRFDPSSGTFRTRSRARSTEERDALKLDPTLSAVPTRFWLVADLRDVTAKYGPRGYRYALIEGGHTGQALIQVLQHAGIDARPFGGFDDAEVTRHLGLPEGWAPVCAVGAIPRPGTADFLEAEELRSILVNGTPLYYATAFGAKVKGNVRECGFGFDTTADAARLRARGELAERLALVRSRDVLGNSNGMAAHTRFDAAAEAAVLELYERHCYMRTWFTAVSPARLTLPDTPLARSVRSLCRAAGVRLTLVDIADPAYGVAAVMVVVHSDAHGGVVTSSGAGTEEPVAAERALREIAKALFYRRVLLKAPVFAPADPLSAPVTEPWEHEAYFAHEDVPVGLTRFLTDGAGPRDLAAASAPLAGLNRAVTVRDLSEQGPDEAAWKIARATSEELLTVDFGSPSLAFRERIRTTLGDGIDIDARWPHPLG
ncbi:YcaO-like family protein [Streptomyces castrisilvae]|uniref:YcaO-like family protein n=1 Tax=Streptomyces castrisilvae TaxID=3033811 RepID=A0ABY9HMC5_9ACTN|nr:YcaO-like family protein [Streptomyces sp. Mut1]WLQ35486.1 YcaO-like family protein [Streptomyces sp. Mut1]